MKRLISLLSVLCIALVLLCGCEKELTAQLPDILDDINTSFSFNDMIILKTPSELTDYYLIETEDVASFAAEFSTGSTYTTEIVLVEAVDEDSAAEICDVLNNYYRARLDMADTYDPQYAQVLSDCSVSISGKYVSLIISDKYDEITALYNSYFE